MTEINNIPCPLREGLSDSDLLMPTVCENQCFTAMEAAIAEGGISQQIDTTEHDQQAALGEMDDDLCSTDDVEPADAVVLLGASAARTLVHSDYCEGCGATMLATDFTFDCLHDTST